MSEIIDAHKFLGRKLDSLTMTYRHDDGSGTTYTLEDRYRIEDAIELNKPQNFPAVFVELFKT